MADLRYIRTDVVGSLLRPEYLKEAWRQRDAGALDDAGLRAVEDRAIREAVALQESVGLDVLTDGEFRRLEFQDSFGHAVAGYEVGTESIGWDEARAELAPAHSRLDHPANVPAGPAITQRRPVRERLRLVRNQPLEEDRVGSSVARTPAKVTLISPDRIQQRWDYA